MAKIMGIIKSEVFIMKKSILRIIVILFFVTLMVVTFLFITQNGDVLGEKNKSNHKNKWKVEKMKLSEDEKIILVK